MIKPSKHGNKYRIRWIDASGKRVSQSFETEEEALIVGNYNAFMAKKNGSKPLSEVNGKRFRELAEYWIEKRLPLKKRSKDDLSILRKHLLPEFENMGLNEITFEDISSLTNKLHKTLSSKSVYNVLTMFRAMLNLAKDLNWINRVPKFELPKKQSFSSKYSYLKTQGEIDRFLKTSKGEDKMVFALYATAVYTGLRQGELSALTWNDIDLNKRLISVSKSFYTTTKSGRARFAPILNPLEKILKDYRKYKIGELVFPNQAGAMHRNSSRVFKNIFHRVLHKAGFEKNPIGKRYITFHDLRHTFASHWVMNGGDVFKLKEILGHSSIEQTMRYSHLNPTAFESDYARLN